MSLNLRAPTLAKVTFSWIRGLMCIICIPGAYAVCGVPSLCHGPYLLITIISGIGTTVFLSVKASLYDNYDIFTGSPVPSMERRHKMGLPLLLVSSAVFALLHIIVAYKARCQARRKLCFDRSDMEASTSKISLNMYQRVTRVSSPKSFRKNDLESNMTVKSQPDDDKDLPAQLLADYDSLFLDLKGLLVHYKSMEGSVYSQIPLRNIYERHELPQYTRSVSHGHFSTAWNPLIRPPIPGALQSYSVHTPLLSGHSGETGYVSYGSPSWGNTAPALNGWPAIMQQTHSRVGTGSEETQGTTSGVIFIHGFGGGVFSWRHLMSAVAREVGCRVVAFDRPGWGLTSRPQRSEWEQKGLPNPYELQTQVTNP